MSTLTVSRKKKRRKEDEYSLSSQPEKEYNLGYLLADSCNAMNSPGNRHQVKTPLRDIIHANS